MINLIKKYKYLSVGVKASFWYMICNLFQKGISFIVVPIYTRLLTTSEYGEYSVFFSWQSILIIFATLNLYCGVYTRNLIKYPDDRDRYTACMQGLSTLITIIFFALYIGFPRVANKFLKIEPNLINILFISFIFYPSVSFWSVRQRVENKYIRMVVVTLIMSVLTPTVNLILLFNTDMRQNSLILGNIGIQILFGIFFYIYHFIKGKVFYIKKYWVEGLKFNIPLIPHYLSLIVLAQSDRIMIQRLCNSSDAGIYSLTHSVAMVLAIFISSISGAFVPWAYEKLRNKTYESLREVSLILTLGMAFITLLIIAIAPEVVFILGGRKYMQSIWCIPPIVLGVYFTFVYDFFADVEFYNGKTKYVAIASTVGAIVNIILNAIFIPRFGFIAAAYTTLFCYTLFALMHYVFMRLVTKEKIYNVKGFFLISLVLSGLTVLFTLSYKNYCLRYSLVVVVLCVFIFKKNLFIQTIKNLKKKSIYSELENNSESELKVNKEKK